MTNNNISGSTPSPAGEEEYAIFGLKEGVKRYILMKSIIANELHEELYRHIILNRNVNLYFSEFRSCFSGLYNFANPYIQRHIETSEDNTSNEKISNTLQEIELTFKQKSGRPNKMMRLFKEYQDILVECGLMDIGISIPSKNMEHSFE